MKKYLNRIKRKNIEKNDRKPAISQKSKQTEEGVKRFGMATVQQYMQFQPGHCCYKQQSG